MRQGQVVRIQSEGVLQLDGDEVQSKHASDGISTATTGTQNMCVSPNSVRAGVLKTARKVSIGAKTLCGTDAVISAGDMILSSPSPSLLKAKDQMQQQENGDDLRKRIRELRISYLLPRLPHVNIGPSENVLYSTFKADSMVEVSASKRMLASKCDHDDLFHYKLTTRNP